MEAPQSRLERAVSRFNTSEAARTVAGLTRTLGRPWVSIGAAAGSPTRFGSRRLGALLVPVGRRPRRRPRPVFQIDKGDEVAELDGSARPWNGAPREGGQVFLGGATPAR